MRVAVTDLLGRPGDTRQLTRDLARQELGEESWGPADDALDGPIHLDLHLDSVVEGILVRGKVDFGLSLSCGRCLEPVADHASLEVAELYRPVGHEDTEPGYVIEDHAIVLDALLHDAVVMAIPLRVLCRDACAGLCTTCGANRNDHDCGHEQTAGGDPRWAPLAGLDLPAVN